MRLPKARAARRRRLAVLLLAGLGLGTAAALTLTAFDDHLVFFHTPSDIADKKVPLDRQMRIGGLVEVGSLERVQGSTEVRFRVTDLEHAVPVAYVGVLPDLFREGQGVVANGKLAADGTFRAREVLARHDENYMPPEVAEALKRSGRWNETMGAGTAPTARPRSTEVAPAMTAELGHYALVLALCVALVQAILPLVGAQKNDAALMALAKPAAFAQFGLVALSFGCLVYAFVVSDFTVSNVVANSHSDKPMLYKVSGSWGNHEGSMVLWALILALFGALVAGFGRNLPDGLKARTLAVQSMVGVAFLAFIVFTSNPFLRVLPPPPDGNGLNPLLQDPGLAFHPPLLYVGYVGFSIVFAFAMAALIEGRVDAAWARWVRPWTLAAWSALTMGIALGSWWAYYELGWGGWWFWDPVENASFMPWLVGTALLHSAIVAEKRDALKTWTILLAILAFALSLLGTFLVRSGVLTSVHAFAVDPARGVFILAILVIAVGGSLAMYAWRAPMLRGGGLFQPISREGGLVLNNVLLSTAAATVLIGTLYPLFLEAVGGAKVSVGPPFFNATFVPLMVPLLLAVSFGPLLGWKRGDLAAAAQRLTFAIAVSVAVVVVVYWADAGRKIFAALAMGLAAWLIAGAAVEWGERVALFRAPASTVWARMRNLPRASWGMTIAHAGLGLMVMGIAGVTAWQTEVIRLVRAGDAFDVAGYRFVFKGVAQIEGPNFFATQATFEVYDNDRLYAVLTPARRFFPVAGSSTTETAIKTNLLADLYATIGDPELGTPALNMPAFLAPTDANTQWTARIYHNPLVPWIWIGACVMAFGGLVSLTDRRHRVGAPRRASLPLGAAQAAE